jgi:hypothetical protein
MVGTSVLLAWHWGHSVRSLGTCGACPGLAVTCRWGLAVYQACSRRKPSAVLNSHDTLQALGWVRCPLQRIKVEEGNGFQLRLMRASPTEVAAWEAEQRRQRLEALYDAAGAPAANGLVCLCQDEACSMHVLLPHACCTHAGKSARASGDTLGCSS